MKTLLLFILLAFAPALALAGNGSAIVPITGTLQNGSYFVSTSIFLTNLTDHTLNVKVTFYAKDGSVVPSTSLIYDNLISSNTQIAAYNSASIILQSSSATFNYGKAIVTWSNVSTDNDSVGLIAHGSFQQYNNGFPWAWAIPINEGRPF